MGVLDAGSNTVHLLVADGHAGGPPLPVTALKQKLRLGDRVDRDGAIDDDGVRLLIECVRQAVAAAGHHGVDELHAFGTAAIRDARNAPEVLQRVERETGVRLMVLSGEQEAQLTFIAARQWLGWSAGPLLLLDIGGGSVEVAWGPGAAPTFAISLPLGAARLTRDWFPSDPPTSQAVKRVRRHVADQVAVLRDRLRWEAADARPVATSRTFQQLARLCGATGDGTVASHRLRADDLRRWLPRLATMPAARRAKLPGISRARSVQSLAGAIVAERLMWALGVDEVTICPWALREGVLLHRLDRHPAPPALERAG
jgi:exopolyphosphatase/guanosine-5'-triphosphate,3'-diphosphate pyrophosphatase